MKTAIINSFKKLLNDTEIFHSNSTYFMALRNWLIDNLDSFDEELLIRNRLDSILNIDINDYMCNLIDHRPIVSPREVERIGKIEYDSIDGLLMVVSDTMWELLSISSDEACNNCGSISTRFVSVVADTRPYLFIECCDCGMIMDLNGISIQGKVSHICPAKKTDIEAILG